MKLRSKYRIVLGTVAAGTTAAAGYGIYSTLKFNDEFQGKGWYVGDEKYETEYEAKTSIKNEIIAAHPKYRIVTMNFKAFAVKGNNGKLHELDFASVSFRILADSDAGKRITELMKHNNPTTLDKTIALFGTDAQAVYKTADPSKISQLPAVKAFSARYENNNSNKSHVILTFNGSKIFKNNVWEFKSNQELFVGHPPQNQLISILTNGSSNFVFPDHWSVNDPNTKTGKINGLDFSDEKDIILNDIRDESEGDIVHVE